MTKSAPWKPKTAAERKLFDALKAIIKVADTDRPTGAQACDLLVEIRGIVWDCTLDLGRDRR